MPELEDQLLISAATLALKLEVSKRTLQRMRDRGAVPKPVYLGRLVRWRLDEVNQWIAAGCPAVEGEPS